MTCIMESFSCSSVLGFLTAVISTGFVWFFILPLTYWRRKGIPHVPALPILGSLKDSLLQNISIAEEHQRIYRATEGYRYSGFQNFARPSLILRDPELIKEVLVKDFSSFHDNDFDVTLSMDPMMGRNLFFMSGNAWRRMRTTLTPAFSPGRVKMVFPLILEIVEDLKQHLSEMEESEIELKELSARLATSVVASCAFGIKIDALRSAEDEFTRVGRKMLEPTPARGLAQLLFMNAPFVSRIFRIKFVPTTCTDFFRGVVRDVVSIRQKSGVVRNDFLNMMVSFKCAGKLGVQSDRGGVTTEEGTTKDEVDLKGLEGQAIKRLLDDPESLDDVTAQLLGFFMDGQETSSTLISFTLFELEHNQDVQEKLRAEVVRVKADHGGVLTYEGLQEMPYLEMVQQESLRKHPPAPFLQRRCTRRHHFPPVDEKTPRESGGFWVEPGTPVLIPIFSIHHDPKYYPDPDTFNPERFSKDSETVGKGEIFLPFGEGPRMCIGNRFARLQSKATIAEVVCNYKLKPCCHRTPVPVELDPASVLLLSKKGLWVEFEKI
ncbi:cytochrome P450 9e2-like [Hetaerina americana]|uniref:cytochrome P450 9e2-like n=1 Tax=Hetaerina americana TaxID=62018 RepID=UPI003A7F2D37